jgi:hypothetical protein
MAAAKKSNKPITRTRKEEVTKVVKDDNLSLFQMKRLANVQSIFIS